MKDEKTVISIVVAILGIICLIQTVTLESYHTRIQEQEQLIQQQDSTIQYYIYTYEND